MSVEFDLEVARARFPLPPGVPDAIVNKTGLAEALGVSTVTIDRWIADGMPVVEAGTNGRSYRFALSDCYAWDQWRRDAQRTEDDRAALAVRQLRLALVGGAAGDGVTGRGFSAKERAAEYEAETAWTKLAEARGDLVPRFEVQATLDAMTAHIRAELEALPDRLAARVGLERRQVAVVASAVDDILAGLARSVDRLGRDLEARRRSIGDAVAEAAE